MADHNTLIGRTAREIDSCTALIGGVVREIESGMTLKNGVAREISFGPQIDLEPTFANNTWGNIVLACQHDIVPDTWKVADNKYMTINNRSYQIDIIGKKHDNYADGSGKAPLTFQMKRCYNTIYKMNSTNTNNGGWGSCAMRNTYLPDIFSLMPAEVRAGVRKVSKQTSAGSQNSSIVSTEDTLFLLSEVEVFGRLTYSYSGEGNQYEYYMAGNSTIKYRNSDSVGDVWKLRSPKSNDSARFCTVSSSGAADYFNASVEHAVVLAFCF